MHPILMRMVMEIQVRSGMCNLRIIKKGKAERAKSVMAETTTIHD